ncbi:50S ribosomal protein L33 [Allobaculum sp. Allo2]|nr:50S ribosomal protein L33 [Allobaculum sp. Allo2]
MRDRITFKCAVCGDENYIGTRNKKKHPERMTIKKYCPKCNKMTEHKERSNRTGSSSGNPFPAPCPLHRRMPKRHPFCSRFFAFAASV